MSSDKEEILQEKLRIIKIASLLFAVVIGILAIAFWIHAASIADTKILGTADENAKREVFEQTKTYRDGVKQDFDQLLLAYTSAPPEQKPAIVSLMRKRAVSVPPELVPIEVQNIIKGAQ